MPSDSSTTSTVLVHQASYAQRQLWFLEQLDPGRSAYNINAAVPLPPGTDPDLLRRAIAELVARHESLRTVFAERDGEPVQIVLRTADVRLAVTDLRGLPAAEEAAQAEHWEQHDAGRPLDLQAGPPMRARLLRGGRGDELVLVVHHLVADAWSMLVLIDDLHEEYEALATGRAPALAPLPVQYADYTAWQRRTVEGPDGAEALAYWRERLADLPTLDLPTDRTRPPVPGVAGGDCEVSIPAEVAEALERVGRQQGATPFMTLLAGYVVLLHRYSGQPEVVLGAPVAGRDAPDLDRVIGLFVNRLVLRVDAGGNPTFRELLDRVRQVCLGAFAHQLTPFEQLVDGLAPTRDTSRAPLVQVGFNLQPPNDAGGAGLAGRGGQFRNGTVRHDLNLDVTPGSAGLRCLLEYRADLFDPETAEQMAEHLRRILAAVAADPDTRIGTLPLLDPAERRRLIQPVGPAADRPPDECVPDMVAAQAARTPEQVAVAGPDGELTFAGLQQEAAELAARLARLGVRRGDVVGVCIEPSTAFVVALLGTMTAGAAYLPLDPADPPHRTAMLLADAGSRVVLVADEPPALPGSLRAVPVHGTARPAGGSDRAQSDVDDPPASAPRPDDLAYVIYTSGSTGRPKGVAVEHRQLAAYAQAIVDRVGFAAGEVSAMVQPTTFDSCLTAIVPPLVTGGLVRLVGRDTARDPAALADLFRRHPVDHLKITPSHLAALRSGADPDAVLPRRALILGGEAVASDWVADLLQHARCAVYNHYGPTETTVGVLCGRLDPAALTGTVTAPLGRPLAGTSVYLLDGHQQPVPPGVHGEIYIGGRTVARGYRGDPEQTAHRFRSDPLAGRPGARMYRTGDRARWLPGGRVEYLGRVDTQVKVRGMRIEPAEVEAALVEHPDVGAAAVAARPGPAGQVLVGYAVPRPGRTVDPGRLREHARRLLPVQMVPAAVVPLDALPLTAHGKVDRAALPAPDLDAAPAERRAGAPRTPAELTLAAIWRDVLGVPEVSVRDNFFDLGGDSILSIRVVARARAAGLALAPGQLFRHQTLGELAAAAVPVAAGGAGIDPAPGPVPLTPAQAGFLAADRDPGRYGQGVLAGLGAAAQLGTLALALQALVHHHDALRLRLHGGPDGWQARVATEAPAVPVQRIDLTGTPAEQRDGALDRLAGRLESTLDLDAGRVLVGAVAEVGAGDRTLLLQAHHFTVDAVSWRILLDDLGAAYRQVAAGRPPTQVELPPAGVGFAGWARLLATEAASPTTAAEAAYWLAPERATVCPVAERLDGLGADPASVAAGGQVPALWVSVAPDLSSALVDEVPAVYGNRVPEVVLAALALTLSPGRPAAAGPGPLLVDLEGHGRVDLRPDVDPSRTVGWFTVGYPALLHVDPAAGPGGALVAVKEQVRAIPRDGVGYGLLRHGGADPAVAARLAALPGADIGFNFLGRLDRLLGQDSSTDLLGAGPPRLLAPAARRHLLDLDVTLENGRLGLGWSYDPSRLSRDRVARLADRMVAALRSLVEHARTRTGPGYTPSDFPLADLDQSELDAVTRALGVDGG